MMQAGCLNIPQVPTIPFEISGLGIFFEPCKLGETKLISSEERLISQLISVLDKLLLSVLDSRNVQEFAKHRENIWPKYIRAIRALADTISNLESEEENELRHEAIGACLEADLEKQRGTRFGSNLVDQALFTLWTYGKVRALSAKIVDAPEPLDQAQDLLLVKDFRLNSLWAQFHLDCVVAAMKFGKKVSNQIQEAICDGLRAAVNAHAILKEALALRVPPVEEDPIGGTLPWDEEDELLLASSMRDLSDHTQHS